MKDKKAEQSDANLPGFVLPKFASELTPQIKMPDLFPQSLIADISRVGAAARALIENMQRAISPAMDAIREILAEVARSRLIERSGWLPHYTTPFDLVGETTNEAEIRALLEQHYKANWSQVREQFLTQVATHRVDETGKAVFREALVAHEAGLYRAVPRLLFPEIERVACNLLYDGQRVTTEQTASGKIQKKRVTGLPGFAELVGELPVGSVLTVNYGVALYYKLVDHLYAKVESSDQIEAARLDPVPNRHATLHGILPYDQPQNSINMLIMTDFMFSLFGEIEHLTATNETRQSAGQAFDL